MSFRLRLLASHLLIILLSLVFLFIGLQGRLRQFYLETVSENLENQVTILSGLFTLNEAGLDGKIDAAAAGVPYRITVVDEGGKVVADSAFSGEALQQLENHSGRPEIADAAREGIGSSLRYSTSVEDDLLYVAARLAGGGYIRVATPLRRVEEIYGHLRYELFSILFLLLLVAGAATWVVARKPIRVITALTDAASGVEAGDYDLSIPVESAGELGRLARAMEQMAERIRTQIASLEGAKNHLNTILNSMSEGLMATDSRGRIVETNRSLERMFHIQGDSRGKLPLEVVRNDEIQKGIEEVLAEPGERRMEARVGPSIVQARFAPVQGTGELEGVVAVFHDITELRRLDTLRKEFVSNVSHELRTPLTSIRGYAELLLEEAEDEESKGFLERIVKHSINLSQMIADLMELARLENRDRKHRQDPISFAAMMSDLKEAFEPVLAQKNLDFKWENQSGMETFTGDAAYLRRVFSNLLENALRYTEKGEIRIVMKRTREQLEFAVSDTGIGIPEEDLGRIFERFYRVEKDRSRTSGGTGIGLAIVKHIVGLHGGRVWAESRLEKGTTIHFTIPG